MRVIFAFLCVLQLIWGAKTTHLLKSRLRYFVNLTNGIEAIPQLLAEKGIAADNIQFVRIQSSHCESADHNAIIQNLDYNFLMNLALGNVCVVYDFGSRGTGMPEGDCRDGIPRAMWWGTEFIRHAIEDAWGLSSSSSMRVVKGYNVEADFNKRLQDMPKNVKKRLKYFRPFVQTDKLRWFNAYSKTDHDGDREWYAQTLAAAKPPPPASQTLCGAGVDVGADIDQDEVEALVIEECLPEGMFLYKHTDFEGFGRAVGFSSSPSSSNRNV